MTDGSNSKASRPSSSGRRGFLKWIDRWIHIWIVEWIGGKQQSVLPVTLPRACQHICEFTVSGVWAVLRPAAFNNCPHKSRRQWSELTHGWTFSSLPYSSLCARIDSPVVVQHTSRHVLQSVCSWGVLVSTCAASTAGRRYLKEETRTLSQEPLTCERWRHTHDLPQNLAHCSNRVFFLKKRKKKGLKSRASRAPDTMRQGKLAAA